MAWQFKCLVLLFAIDCKDFFRMVKALIMNVKSYYLILVKNMIRRLLLFLTKTIYP